MQLLTYHRSKGLEFEAVFLPRLEEKELPSKLARTLEDEAEERRLFYVGITRARRFLAITWSKRPSAFISELGLSAQLHGPSPESRAPREVATADDPALYDALVAWRKSRAKLEDGPRVHRLPQQRPRRDLGRASGLARRARRSAGRRPGEARALRSGSARRALRSRRRLV